MKTEDILQLDYRKDENKKIIQKVLRKIKPFEKYDISEDIPIEVLEKLPPKYQYKYNFHINSIGCNYQEGNVISYTAYIIRNDDFTNFKHIYGCCLYELFAKICIYYYSVVKKENS